MTSKQIIGMILTLIAVGCKDKEFVPVDFLTDPSVMPKVIYTFPVRNSTGPYDNFGTNISLRFNKIMDLSSLQRAVRIVSPAGDFRSDTIRVSSSGGDVVSVTPLPVNVNVPFLWKVDQTYTLRVDASARDVNGNTLSQPFEMTINPEPYFRVKSISPAGGMLVTTGAQIRIQFNSLVDTSMFSLITISPAVSGTWRFSGFNSFILDSSSIFFQPSGGGLASGTTYSLNVSGTATDKGGNSLVSGFSSAITTVPFAVVSTTPFNGASDISLLNTLYLQLNAAADTGTIRPAFAISPAVAGLIGYSSFRGATNTITFSPVVSFMESTTYNVTLDSTLMSAYGNHLTPFHFSFTTAPFKLLSTSPQDGATHISLHSSIGISASSFIDTSTIRSAFSINPPVEGTFIAADPGANFEFRPGVLQPFTVYTVTISTGLHSRSGAALQSAYAFSFATGN